VAGVQLAKYKPRCRLHPQPLYHFLLPHHHHHRHQLDDQIPHEISLILNVQILSMFQKGKTVVEEIGNVGRDMIVQGIAADAALGVQQTVIEIPNVLLMWKKIEARDQSEIVGVLIGSQIDTLGE